MNKRNPAQMPNKSDMFQQNVAIGQTNEAFIQNDTDTSKRLEQSPTYINFRTHSSNATLRSGVIVSRPSSTSSSSLSGASLDISPLMSLKKQSTPPKALNAARPKAALNKTVPAQASIDSDSGSEASRGDSKIAIKYKNVDPGVISPKSYLSMPSVKSFPRGNNPEPLNKVLEPISVLHLDIDDEGLDALDSDRRLDGLLTRYGSLSVVEDPGVIGPIVWSEHCKRLQRGVSMDQGMDDGKLKGNSSKMRKRFHDLLDETFSLFGSRRDSPVEEGRPIAFEVKSHSANMTRYVELEQSFRLQKKIVDLQTMFKRIHSVDPKPRNPDELWLQVNHLEVRGRQTHRRLCRDHLVPVPFREDLLHRESMSTVC
uniref:Uncharacterized protein n=4 Tax=Photinus pyralis TaxID=7054 RepID=A0A1Y1LJ67_PHOPY